ncbi:MAG: rhomboid family intramembrane serine protease [Pseudomonadales bacterium]|nr:rhomboid family intramembrane serine protease [Pseudomonadales bacterium]
MKLAWQRLKLLFFLAAFLIVVQVINASNGYFLTPFGVLPRHEASLPFILSAPFIHGSYSHLFNNLVGLGIFSSLCLLRSMRFYLLSSGFIIVLSGLLVWFFARPAYHVGASGWVFGLWALVIANAYFEASIKNILLSLLVIILYGGMAYGVLPGDKAVSFEFHLAGAFAGIVAAFIASKFGKQSGRKLKRKS